MNLLSIVIITRNEQRKVGSCIESALKAANRFPETEIILVDSASTDATCDIAQRYPISIVQLKPDWRLTPAAGRYIGTLLTSNEYILFLDGDMELCVDWVEVGVQFLQANPQAAAVSGEMDEVYVDDQDQVVDVLHNRYNVQSVIEVRALGGAGLYRRTALNQVGTFNPFVPLREEAELALRLRRANYKLFRIPNPVTVHYSLPRQTMREVGRRYRAGFYAGFGRALYYSARNGLGWQFIREQGVAYLNFAGYLLVGILSLLFLVFTSLWAPIALWIGLTAVIFVAYALRKDGFRNAMLGFVARGLMVYGSVTGSISALRDPAQYPTDVTVVREMQTRTVQSAFEPQ